MAHFLFHQVGGCVIFQIYPIMFCFTRSVGVWFVICIPWIIFRFTRFDGVWCVRHIPWNTLCFTRSEHVSHGIFSVLPGQQAWICQTFSTIRSAGVWFVRWMPWGIFGFSRSGGVWFVNANGPFLRTFMRWSHQGNQDWKWGWDVDLCSSRQTVFQVTSIARKTTKYHFTDFICWAKGKGSGSSRVGVSHRKDSRINFNLVNF